MISGFCSIVNEIFTLLACNAEMIGRYQHFSDCLTLEDGTLVVPKHGYTNYYCIGIFIISHYNEPQTTEQPTHTHTSASQLHHNSTISRGKTSITSPDINLMNSV